MIRIYRPAKTATQSGRAHTRQWLAEFETQGALGQDPLMGWVSSQDTRQQLRLAFDTLEDAIEYARKKKIPYTIYTPTHHSITPKDYGENFTNPHIRGK